MHIWMYWEGPLPEWIRLCQESIKKHSHGKTIVLNDQSFDQIRKQDRDIPIEKLYVAHRADFIRAYVLKHYGGLWIDSDCIAMRDLTPILKSCEFWDFVAYRQWSGKLSNAFIGAKKGSVTAADFYSEVAQVLRKSLTIDWTDIGEECLHKAFAMRESERLKLAVDMISPFCWSDNQKFLDKKESHSYNKNAITYMMSNHSIKSLDGFSDILDYDTLFSFLIRKSNENCIST